MNSSLNSSAFAETVQTLIDDAIRSMASELEGVSEEERAQMRLGLQYPSADFLQLKEDAHNALMDAFTDVSVRGLNTLQGHGPINPSVNGDDETDTLKAQRQASALVTAADVTKVVVLGLQKLPHRGRSKHHREKHRDHDWGGVIAHCIQAWTWTIGGFKPSAGALHTIAAFPMDHHTVKVGNNGAVASKPWKPRSAPSS